MSIGGLLIDCDRGSDSFASQLDPRSQQVSQKLSPGLQASGFSGVATRTLTTKKSVLSYVQLYPSCFWGKGEEGV